MKPASVTRRTALASTLLPACVIPGGFAPRTRLTNATAARPAPDVEALLAQMTLDEKIGQMTQADLKALKPETDVRKLGLGSVLSGGDSLPRPNTAEGWADVYDRLQAQALDTRLGIPLLYGIDAVHGNNGLRGAVVFPHNIGLGCTRDAALVERVARVTAEELAATGFDWAFAPCVAVPRDERWGRTYEGFGENPELVAELGAASVRGLQGASLAAPTSVLACAKHFVGDGGTFGGKDQGDARVSEADLRRIHLPGYRAAIAAGVGSVMISYSSWNGQPMHGNRRLITDVLKGELGFTGLVVTDWAAIDKMPGDYASDVENAINAGIDMVMVPIRYAVFIQTLRALVDAGRVPPARIDDAVRRILRTKVALGLWQRPLSDRAQLGSVGTASHRDVAREAVRKSVVVLKNDGAVLPLRKDRKLHVVGARADDLGAHCGGWTVSWQGKRGAITDGTPLRQALGGATFSADGLAEAEARAADVIVAVVGENPYAEMRGDRQNLAISAEDVALVDRAAATGKPVVLVVLSGRPMILEAVLSKCAAIVAAWLPGTEGAGIADVLTGAFAPVGKLSHTWPRSMAQIPINVDDADVATKQPLFPYGFGLTWPAKA